MKRPLFLAVGILIALGTAGCTAGQLPASGSEAGMPAKNLEQWALPLDQFANQSSALRDYVENLMISPCMGKQGIDWPAPWQPLDRPAKSASFTAGGARLFDAKIAEEYGYHLIPRIYKGKAEQLAAFQTTSALVQGDPSVGKKFDACLQEVRKTIPLIPIEDSNYATIFASQIHSSSQEDAAVKAAENKWQACVNVAGFGGLAETPSQMPGPSKLKEWQLEGGATTSSISAVERRTASADAKCRTSSGWSQALYDVEYAKQVKLVQTNADKLNRIREQLKKERQRLLEIAPQYAPK